MSKAEQIKEKGRNNHIATRRGKKYIKRRTNKEIRKLPLSLGKWIRIKDVIQGYLD